MEERTAQRLLKEVKEIRDFLLGNAEFQENGFIADFKELQRQVISNTEEIRKLKNTNFKIGAIAGAAGIGVGAGLKALLVKLVTVFSTLPIK